MTDDQGVTIKGGNIDLPGTERNGTSTKLGFMDITLTTGTPLGRLWLNRATRRHIERYRHRHPAQWEQR